MKQTLVFLAVILMMFSSCKNQESKTEQNSNEKTAKAETNQTNNDTYVKMGEQVPNFVFAKSETETVEYANLNGKVILVNLFATWCPPCLKELPHIQSDIWNTYQNNEDFVMLTFGREHSWEEVDTFKQEKGFTFPIYPDPKREVFSTFAKQSIPRSFLIDRDGKIIFMSTGFNHEQFNTLLGLLKEKL